MLSLKVHNGHVVKLTLPDGRSILIRRHEDVYLSIEAPRDISIERLGHIDLAAMKIMCNKLHEEATDGDGAKDGAPHV